MLGIPHLPASSKGKPIIGRPKEEKVFARRKSPPIREVLPDTDIEEERRIEKELAMEDAEAEYAKIPAWKRFQMEEREHAELMKKVDEETARMEKQWKLEKELKEAVAKKQRPKRKKRIPVVIYETEEE